MPHIFVVKSVKRVMYIFTVSKDISRYVLAVHNIEMLHVSRCLNFFSSFLYQTMETIRVRKKFLQLLVVLSFTQRFIEKMKALILQRATSEAIGTRIQVNRIPDILAIRTILTVKGVITVIDICALVARFQSFSMKTIQAVFWSDDWWAIQTPLRIVRIVDEVRVLWISTVVYKITVFICYDMKWCVGNDCFSSWNCSKNDRSKSGSRKKANLSHSSDSQCLISYTGSCLSGEYAVMMSFHVRSHVRLYRWRSFRNARRRRSRSLGQSFGVGIKYFLSQKTGETRS